MGFTTGNALERNNYEENKVNLKAKKIYKMKSKSQVIKPFDRRLVHNLYLLLSCSTGRYIS